MVVELSQFGALDPGIQGAADGVPGRLAGHGEVVAVVNRRRVGHLDIERFAQQAHLEHGLGQHLTEQFAAEAGFAIFGGDQRITGDQGSAQTPFHFLLGLALGDDCGGAAGDDHAAGLGTMACMFLVAPAVGAFCGQR
ncbi:hypothetical protein [Magnetospirillum sp. 15-1]|uniref:hypothetical protein n=1 Tax=Magnetospirillum sp. 15-1 TaxID=1979370 RepID=UPI000BBBD804|nr:hypothetical protein [Magnetospirillum sp. 15-1]